MKANKKLFLSTITILGIAWLIVMLLLGGVSAAGQVGTIGFVFGILGFILVLAFNLVPEKEQVPNDASALVIPFTVSVLFLGASVVVNTVLIVLAGFLGIHFPLLAALAVIINVLLVAGFSVYALYALAYLGSLKRKDKTVRQRTSRTAQISSMLGGLLAMAESAQEKNALRQLKEAVDFSTNSTTGLSMDLEESVMRQLTEIQTAIANHESSESVTDRINTVLHTWHSRNAING